MRALERQREAVRAAWELVLVRASVGSPANPPSSSCTPFLALHPPPSALETRRPPPYNRPPSPSRSAPAPAPVARRRSLLFFLPLPPSIEGATPAESGDPQSPLCPDRPLPPPRRAGRFLANFEKKKKIKENTGTRCVSRLEPRYQKREENPVKLPGKNAVCPGRGQGYDTEAFPTRANPHRRGLRLVPVRIPRQYHRNPPPRRS